MNPNTPHSSGNTSPSDPNSELDMDLPSEGAGPITDAGAGTAPAKKKNKWWVIAPAAVLVGLVLWMVWVAWLGPFFFKPKPAATPAARAAASQPAPTQPAGTPAGSPVASNPLAATPQESPASAPSPTPGPANPAGSVPAAAGSLPADPLAAAPASAPVAPPPAAPSPSAAPPADPFAALNATPASAPVNPSTVAPMPAGSTPATPTPAPASDPFNPAKPVPPTAPAAAEPPAVPAPVPATPAASVSDVRQVIRDELSPVNQRLSALETRVARLDGPKNAPSGAVSSAPRSSESVSHSRSASTRNAPPRASGNRLEVIRPALGAMPRDERGDVRPRPAPLDRDAGNTPKDETAKRVRAEATEKAVSAGCELAAIIPGRAYRKQSDGSFATFGVGDVWTDGTRIDAIDPDKGVVGGGKTLCTGRR